ncbi:Thioredoxin reductase 2, mitochondrial [Trichoplax sp. H2]|nr:Thioredoxin reductase 2, mitochondrial [Trichoplax sp. H2]|eukprot:RDD47328.1 Thioredoxin reductase 2, mitochondrial [Trichoplax sp. H2]
MRSNPALLLLAAHFDLVVIGGGSGGLACAKEASTLGKKVAIVDHVEPTVHGTTWGLGGTCVNVGCIPKKLMHQAALLGQSLQDARHYGWQLPSSSYEHSWDTLRDGVRNYIKSLNWGYRVQLKNKKIDYLNGKGTFLSRHEIKVDLKSGSKILSADNYVIAVGGRPRIPNNIPGAREYAISSDDLFSLDKAPGKVLIIGAGYIALECAGFLSGIGCDTSIMARSICLRSFDQDMVSLITENMEEEGISFIRKSQPLRMSKTTGDKIEVEYENTETGLKSIGLYDNVMFAVGRDPTTASLNLNVANVKIHPESKKILAENEQTTCPNIYAIGDVLHGKPELTPVAIHAGKLLARRLCNVSSTQMDYAQIPTTIFTPLEYGCIGISEAKAEELYFKENIEVYHAFYLPLEYAITQRVCKQCYVKAVCLKSDNERIIGLHFLGPNAGEVIQGFATALKCGVTFDQVVNTIGIHPTCAEEVVKLRISRSSGEDPTVTGC